MGVPGLWPILNKAGKSRAVAQLAVVDGFEKNEAGSRSLRVGIDASIWLEHATYSAGPKEAADTRGANPELRTLFFRLCKLSRLPLSLLFVFDGRERPKTKRGSRKGKSGSHKLAAGFKKLIELFGMEWREARGEAEAELAFLNQVGSLDAIISDDVDTFVFGARVVIKNMSLKLTGNKAHPAVNANGKPSDSHAHIYNADELAAHPDVQLTRGGLILFALISGGDYDDGLHGCGEGTAHPLARLDFGDRLVSAYEAHNSQRMSGRDFQLFLAGWRNDLTREIQTNEHGLFSRRRPSYIVPPEFPSLKTLELYLHPLTSASDGRTGGGPPRDRHSIDLPALAAFCENHFDEWGSRSMILKRFGSLLTQSLVMTVLKAAALDMDKREKDRQDGHRHARTQGPSLPEPHEGVSTSATLVRKCLVPKKRATRDERMERIASAFVNRGSPEPEEEERVVEVEDRNPLVVGITRTREHVSTDKLLEYRVEVCPRQFVEIINSGIKGKHPDPRGAPTYDSDDNMDDDDPRDTGSRTKSTDPNANLLLWIPAPIVRKVHPELVEQYEEKQRAKHSPRKRGSDNQQATTASARTLTSASATQSKRKTKARAVADPDYDFLAVNPHASAAPPKEDLDIFAPSSQPTRYCGFVFTWPDPDDPDQLVVDPERDDLPTTVDFAALDEDDRTVLPSQGKRAPTAVSRSKGKGRAQAVGALNAVAPTQTRKRKQAAKELDYQREEAEPWSEPEDDGPLSFLNDAIDRALGIKPSGSSQQKGKAKPGRKPRKSAPAPVNSVRVRDQVQARPAEDPVQRIPPAKRRKTIHGTSDKTDSGSSGQNEELRDEMHEARASRVLDPREVDKLIRALPPSPSWSPVQSPVGRPAYSIPSRPSALPSSTLPSASRAAPHTPRRRSSIPMDDDIIEISSSSDEDDAMTGLSSSYDDDDFWNKAPFNGTPSRYSQRKAAEAQLSLLQASTHVDEDDPMEEGAPDQPVLEEHSHQVPHKSRASRSDTRKYRDSLVPLSSQESRLDDNDDGDFFEGVSAIINLC